MIFQVFFGQEGPHSHSCLGPPRWLETPLGMVKLTLLLTNQSWEAERAELTLFSKSDTE